MDKKAIWQRRKGFLQMKTYQEVSRRLITASILGDVGSLNGRPMNRRLILTNLLHDLEREIGTELYKRLLPESRAIMHAIIDSIFNAICGCSASPGGDIMQYGELSKESSEFVALFVTKVTGGKDMKGRWNSEVYSAKKAVEAITTYSFSGVSLEEFRNAYDELVRQIVDDVHDAIILGKKTTE